MVGLLINQEDEGKLVKLKVRDSKLLTPKQRNSLYPKILKVAKNYKVVILSPQEIDDALNSDVSNLNWLEADTSAAIINELEPDKAIIDSPSNNIKKYQAYLASKLKGRVELRLEHKADVKYPVVSAASIIAKVTRDKEIEKLKKKIGADFGSGYVSDPYTRSFLEKNYEKYPDIFRKTWDPYRRLAQQKGQKSLDEY